jgi:DNA-binding MarR family transcriptional regulator
MSTIRAHDRRAVAAEVWRLLAGFTAAKMQSGLHSAAAREHGLSPGHMKALSMLDPDEPKPMRALADALVCDASTVTWLVDRLEERGLVERRPLPEDRRVKTLILTPLGIRTREELSRALYEPPDELLALDPAALETLRDALRALPAPVKPFWSGGPPRGDRPAAESEPPLERNAEGVAARAAVSGAAPTVEP